MLADSPSQCYRDRHGEAAPPHCVPGHSRLDRRGVITSRHLASDRDAVAHSACRPVGGLGDRKRHERRSRDRVPPGAVRGRLAGGPSARSRPRDASSDAPERRTALRPAVGGQRAGPLHRVAGAGAVQDVLPRGRPRVRARRAGGPREGGVRGRERGWHRVDAAGPRPGGVRRQHRQQRHSEGPGHGQLRPVSGRQPGGRARRPLQGGRKGKARAGTRALRLQVSRRRPMDAHGGPARRHGRLLRLPEPGLLGRRSRRVPRVPSRLSSRARLQRQQERPRYQDRRDQGLPRLARPGVDQLLAGPDERAVYQPGQPVLPGAPPVPGVPDALRGPGLDRVDEVVAAPGVQAVSSDEIGAGGDGRHRRDVDVEQRRPQLRRMAGVVQQARAPHQRQLAVRRQLPEPGAHRDQVGNRGRSRRAFVLRHGGDEPGRHRGPIAALHDTDRRLRLGQRGGWTAASS